MFRLLIQRLGFGRRAAAAVSFVLTAAFLASWPPVAEARSLDACQLAWSKAVRSYLTKNRKAAPDGTVPNTMEAMEEAAQRWLSAFRPACQIEAAGDKPSARVEAATLGVKILARLDLRGCTRFLEYYMESTRSQDICRAATSGRNSDLREDIQRSIPAPRP